MVITFESGDEESVDGWTDVPVMQNVEDHKTIFRKISNMVKNVRYLYNLLGTTDISGCGADTVTGAIKKLSERKIPNVTRSASVTQEGQLALDAVEKNAAVPGTMAYDLAQINSNLSSVAVSPIQYANGFYDQDQNWKTLVFIVGKIMIINVNCKCDTDISGNVVVGYINNCYGNITTAAVPYGRLTISRGNHLNYDPLGTTLKSGTWIMGSLITLLG